MSGQDRKSLIETALKTNDELSSTEFAEKQARNRQYHCEAFSEIMRLVESGKRYRSMQEIYDDYFKMFDKAREDNRKS